MQVEHVEPIRPIGPRRGSRLRSLVVVLLPIGLLVAVAGTAILGGVGEGEGQGALEALRSVPPSLHPASSGTPGPQVALADAPEETRVPRTAVGIPVRTVAATLDDLERARHRDTLVAVSGWMTIAPRHVDCEAYGTSMLTSPLLCQRGTVLRDSAEPLLATEDGEVVRLRSPGIHLHPQALPGTSLWPLDQPAVTARNASIEPVAVVVLGRFGDPRLPECRPAQRHCGESFAIERIIWVDGVWQDRRSEVGPGLDDGDLPARLSRLITQDSIRDSRVVLSEILVTPDQLTRIDPAAAAQVDDADGPLWYLRLVVRRPTPDGALLRDVGWAVVDDASGRVLAADPPRRSRLGH